MSIPEERLDAPTVLVLRGLPGSGKSTWAREHAAQAVPGTVVRINNDDLAQMLFGDPWGSRSKDSAALLAGARLGLLNAALANPSVRMVIVDNTNLAVKTVKALESAARTAGATFIVDDRFLSVPVAVCIERDAQREASVGRDVIEKMSKQASGLKPWVYATNPNVEPYPNDDESLPETVIVDIDGTLALMGDRSPYDWARVGEDAPNAAVVGLVRSLLAEGQHVTIMSGRDGSCRSLTRDWLNRHVAPGLPLYMRAAGDMRPDNIIKHELFHEHVAGRHRVRFVLDDRDQVVRLWRDGLRLPTFQVADGNF